MIIRKYLSYSLIFLIIEANFAFRLDNSFPFDYDDTKFMLEVLDQIDAVGQVNSRSRQPRPEPIRPKQSISDLLTLFIQQQRLIDSLKTKPKNNPNTNKFQLSSRPNVESTGNVKIEPVQVKESIFGSFFNTTSLGNVPAVLGNKGNQKNNVTKTDSFYSLKDAFGNMNGVRKTKPANEEAGIDLLLPMLGEQSNGDQMIDDIKLDEMLSQEIEKLAEEMLKQENQNAGESQLEQNAGRPNVYLPSFTAGIMSPLNTGEGAPTRENNLNSNKKKLNMNRVSLTTSEINKDVKGVCKYINDQGLPLEIHFTQEKDSGSPTVTKIIPAIPMPQKYLDECIKQASSKKNGSRRQNQKKPLNNLHPTDTANWLLPNDEKDQTGILFGFSPLQKLLGDHNKQSEDPVDKLNKLRDKIQENEKDIQKPKKLRLKRIADRMKRNGIFHNGYMTDVLPTAEDAQELKLLIESYLVILQE